MSCIGLCVSNSCRDKTSLIFFRHSEKDWLNSFAHSREIVRADAPTLFAHSSNVNGKSGFFSVG